MFFATLLVLVALALMFGVGANENTKGGRIWGAIFSLVIASLGCIEFYSIGVGNPANATKLDDNVVYEVVGQSAELSEDTGVVFILRDPNGNVLAVKEKPGPGVLGARLVVQRDKRLAAFVPLGGAK